MMVAEVSDTGQMDLLRLLNTQVSENNTGQREALLEWEMFLFGVLVE